MRVITGKYKGRHFDIPRSFKARPTTDFAKENIFNVLMGYIDFEGAEALDLFAGTGSITLELLSRGCAHVTSVELDRDHHRFICECVKKLEPIDHSPLTIDLSGARRNNGQCSMVNVQCIRTDAFRFIRSCKQQYDFIFADPPYALKELPQIPELIFGTSTHPSSLLKPGGIFVFEHGSTYDFSRHPNFVEHREYGSVNFSIFRGN